MSFRTQMRDAAARSYLQALKRLGGQGTLVGKDYSQTLWMWAGASSKELAEVLDVEAESDARTFWLPRQTNFNEDNVHLDYVITWENHNYHVKRTNNEDGIEAIFQLDGVCTHPNKVGTK